MSSTNSNTDNLRKVALVIGNSNYEHMDYLHCSINDAELVQSTLQKLGFEVVLLKDVKHEELKGGIEEFGEDFVKPGDLVLFYFSGHAGQQFNAVGQTFKQNGVDNYLFGIDAKLQEGGNTRGVAVQDQIISKYFLYDCIYLLVLDACRIYPEKNKSFTTKSDPGEKICAVTINPKLTFAKTEPLLGREYDIIYACQPNKFAIDDEKRQYGYLASAFSKSLTSSNTWADAAIQMKREVKKNTNGIQIPAIEIGVTQSIQILNQDMTTSEQSYEIVPLAGSSQGLSSSSVSESNSKSSIIPIITFLEEALPSSTQGSTSGAGESMEEYFVERGDNLYKISKRFGVGIRDILIANPEITNPDKIFAAQRIKIPHSSNLQSSSSSLDPPLSTSGSVRNSNRVEEGVRSSTLRSGIEYNSDENEFENDRKGELFLMGRISEHKLQLAVLEYDFVAHYFAMVYQGEKIFVFERQRELYHYYTIETDREISECLKGNLCKRLGHNNSPRQVLQAGKEGELRVGEYNVENSTENHWAEEVSEILGHNCRVWHVCNNCNPSQSGLKRAFGELLSIF